MINLPANSFHPQIFALQAAGTLCSVFDLSHSVKKSDQKHATDTQLAYLCLGNKTQFSNKPVVEMLKLLNGHKNGSNVNKISPDRRLETQR
jgi:hypothetical protein